MSDTTTKMRGLLARWVEVEPEWCENHNRHSFTRDEEDDNFYIKDGDGNTWGWHLVLSDSNITDEEGYYPYKRDALMHIQAAVQDATVARGWAFAAKYIARQKRYLASVGFTYDQEGANPAEAILSAYLKEIEAQDQ